MQQLKVFTKDKIEITINNFNGDLEQIALDLLDESIPFLFLPKIIVSKANISSIFAVNVQMEEEEFNRWESM